MPELPEMPEADERDQLHRQQMALWQARLLDLRTYIAALFLIFGGVVTISGLVASPAEIAKAAGININLWAGISMLILSAIFGIWAVAVPPEVPEPSAGTLEPTTETPEV